MQADFGLYMMAVLCVFGALSAATARPRLLHVVDDKLGERGGDIVVRRGHQLCPSYQDSVQPRPQRPAAAGLRH